MVLACVVALVAGMTVIACAQGNRPAHSSPARVTQQREQQLALARQLLSEVERSPSAYLGELRAKLRQARAAAQAVLEASPQHPEALQLLARIDFLLAELTPRSRPDHPTEAEAAATLERLEALVKGGGTRGDVEAQHTDLRRVVRRLKEEQPGIAVLYQKRAEYLWAEYAKGLGKVRDVCFGCPVLDVEALAGGFSRPRLLGAGDYALEDLEKMPADTATQKPAHTPLLTGDFNGDGILDVALIGRGVQRKKERLFVLIATVKGNGYRRLFLMPLDWDKAALTHGTDEGVEGRTIILSDIFEPTDDFWTLRWNGRTFVLRYAGDEMEDCSKGGGPNMARAEKLTKKRLASGQEPAVTITVLTRALASGIES